jgi:hypothetical protein
MESRASQRQLIPSTPERSSTPISSSSSYASSAVVVGGGLASIAGNSPRGRPVSLSVSFTGRIGLVDAGDRSNLV